MTIGMVCMGEAHVLVGVSVEKKGSGLVCEMDRRRDRRGGKQTGSYFHRHVTRVGRYFTPCFVSSVCILSV